MALEKQPINIDFSQGLDLKTDPYQLSVGKFLGLENVVFTKNKKWEKRNGYAQLTSLSSSDYTLATTFNGNLLAVGPHLSAFSAGSETWVNKGSIIQAELSTQALIRSNTNQSYADAAVSSNGLICTVFTDNIPSGGSTVASYKYAIADELTGQNIIAPTVIAPATGTVTGSPKVFNLGKYFIIVFTNVITATNHLQYIAINTVDPTLVSANTDITALYTPATSVAWDGVVANDTLYLGWNGSDGGGAIRMCSLSSTLVVSAAVVFAGRSCSIMSLAADNSGSSPVIYASFYNVSGTTGYVLAVNQGLTTILAPTQWIAAGTVKNVTSSASSGTVTIIYELAGTYTYDTSIATNRILYRTCTSAGSLGTATSVCRGVGLASESFYIGTTIYFLSVYSSSNQPSYFLLNLSGQVIAKLAYSNGSGYLTTGLPQVTLSDNVVNIPYLIKDLIEAVNKTQGLSSQVAGATYSQTGVNLATIDFNASSVQTNTAEIGQNLNLSGGITWAYDGYAPVEQGFNLWPDYVEAVGSSTSGSMTAQQYYYVATYEWSDNQGNIFRSAPSIPVSFTILTAPVSFTGNRTSGSPILTGVSSTANLQVGQAISGTGIPASTFILSIDSSSQITMTNNATSGTATSTTVTPVTATSAAVNVPSLRLTYKTANPVKIVIYRASVAQATFYQATSVSVPVLNDTTVDYVTFTDTQADSSILGNSILYTTGGVIENIGPPASIDLALFKSRLFLIDAEDRNLLWFSKQVIEGTPVEMSDLFTLYIAPTTGAQGSTGQLTCLSAMDDKLIMFKETAIYYLVGNGPDNVGSNNDFSEPVFITATVGCTNKRSIVFIPQGLMFKSDKGIWLLGRDLSTTYIGSPVEDFNEFDIDSAVNIPDSNIVKFTLSNGVTLVYNYFFDQWGTEVGVPAISSTLYENMHTVIDSFGRVFQQTTDSYLDGTRPVLINFTTGWLNLAGLQGFERFYYFYILGTYFSPHKLTVQIAYNYSPSASQSIIISPVNTSTVYGGDSLYGGSETYGGPLRLEQWRVFPELQKCESFQISIQESYDPSLGIPAGEGLSLSGMNMIVGLKKGYYPVPSTLSTG